MHKDNEYFIVTSLKSALETLVLLQDDATKDHPVCDDIGATLELPIWAIQECINLI